MQVRMTQNANPLEKATAERINGILKHEFILKIMFKNLQHAQGLLKEIIEIYNHERPHLSVRLLTPQQAHELEGKLEKYWKTILSNQCKHMLELRLCLKIIFVEFHNRFKIIWQLAHKIHASALLVVFS